MERIGAIETEYAGHLFRSRLEARWAVFFDALGVRWQYEVQGFENACGDRYLPDFYLPDTGIWVEVKGDPMALTKTWEKQVRLHRDAGCLPGFSESIGSNVLGLLLLGDLPNPRADQLPFHAVIQRAENDSLRRTWGAFVPGKDGIGKFYVDDCNSLLHWLNGVGPESGAEATADLWKVEHRLVGIPGRFPSLCAAYRSARQARFEHGQSGAR